MTAITKPVMYQCVITALELLEWEKAVEHTGSIVGYLDDWLASYCRTV